MRKLSIILVLLLVLSVSTAFADHPAGWGVGILGRGAWSYGYDGYGGLALSLKAPMLPVFWGLNLDFGVGHFGIGVTGDFYFIDMKIADFNGPNLGWYLGVGGYFTFSSRTGGHFDYNGRRRTASWTSLALGARIPIGLSFQIPISAISLEIFAALIPNLGLGFWFWDSMYDDYWKDHDRGHVGFTGGVGGELGVRVWF